MIDLKTLDDEQLDDLRIAVLTEQERRVIVATAQDEIARIEAAYEQATQGAPNAVPLAFGGGAVRLQRY